jgi:2'-5' RNA ligase
VRIDPFDVVFDRIEAFPGKRERSPVVLRSDAETDARTQKLCDSIRMMMRRVGIMVAPGSRITPHVTMFYDPLHRTLAEPIEPVCWRVSEFVLIRSHYGYATHEILGRWPLTNNGQTEH